LVVLLGALVIELVAGRSQRPLNTPTTLVAEAGKSIRHRPSSEAGTDSRRR
jgi:hypothetical protein